MEHRFGMLMLVLSAITESAWNVVLKKSTGLTDWGVNGVGILLVLTGVFLFKKSLDSISLSIAALVWSVISLTLTIGLDMLFFKTRFDLLTAGFMVLSMLSIIGLSFSAGR
ncbi:MAG: DMT family transporter [Mucilaginibacter sp.]